MIDEPTIWMQMGISEERYDTVVSKEIASMLATKDTIGNMMLMLQVNGKLTQDEKYYVAFAISKQSVVERLVKALPMGKGFVRKLLEE